MSPLARCAMCRNPSKKMTQLALKGIRNLICYQVSDTYYPRASCYREVEDAAG